MTPDSEGSLHSLRFLDHTADVGLEVEGPTLPWVMERAVEGMMQLILGHERPAEEAERILMVRGNDTGLLLRNLLRELLYLHEAEGFATAGCQVEVRKTTESPLQARCRAVGGVDPVRPRTELKGVTLHGLVAEPAEGGGWFARVIFDV